MAGGVSNERSLAAWEKMTGEQQMDLGRGHMKLNQEMAEAGVHVASLVEGLVRGEDLGRSR